MKSTPFTNQTTQDIILALQTVKNEQRLKMALRNYPTKLEIIGVTVPNIKIILKELRQLTNQWTIEEKKTLAQQLVNTNYHECHHLSYMYLEQEKTTLKSLTANECTALGTCLDNWVLIDTYCTYILGVLWRDGRISNKYIHTLADSEDLWRKRCALVCTVALNQKARGGKGDVLRTIEVCEKAIDDKRPLIIKALSWALRVLIAIDRNAVEGFLATYDTQLSNAIIREVNNKLSTGLKNP